MPKANTYRMSRCIFCRDVTKNVAKNGSFDVSIYVMLFCNDVTHQMYRNTMRYINMPNLLVLLYGKMVLLISKIS